MEETSKNKHLTRLPFDQSAVCDNLNQKTRMVERYEIEDEHDLAKASDGNGKTGIAIDALKDHDVPHSTEVGLVNGADVKVVCIGPPKKYLEVVTSFGKTKRTDYMKSEACKREGAGKDIFDKVKPRMPSTMAGKSMRQWVTREKFEQAKAKVLEDDAERKTRLENEAKARIEREMANAKAKEEALATERAEKAAAAAAKAKERTLQQQLLAQVAPQPRQAISAFRQAIGEKRKKKVVPKRAASQLLALTRTPLGNGIEVNSSPEGDEAGKKQRRKRLRRKSELGGEENDDDDEDDFDDDDEERDDEEGEEEVRDDEPDLHLMPEGLDAVGRLEWRADNFMRHLTPDHVFEGKRLTERVAKAKRCMGQLNKHRRFGKGTMVKNRIGVIKLSRSLSTRRVGMGKCARKLKKALADFRAKWEEKVKWTEAQRKAFHKRKYEPWMERNSNADELCVFYKVDPDLVDGKGPEFEPEEFTVQSLNPSKSWQLDQQRERIIAKLSDLMTDGQLAYESVVNLAQKVQEMGGQLHMDVAEGSELIVITHECDPDKVQRFHELKNDMNSTISWFYREDPIYKLKSQHFINNTQNKVNAVPLLKELKETFRVNTWDSNECAEQMKKWTDKGPSIRGVKLEDDGKALLAEVEQFAYDRVKDCKLIVDKPYEAPEGGSTPEHSKEMLSKMTSARDFLKLAADAMKRTENFVTVKAAKQKADTLVLDYERRLKLDEFWESLGEVALEIAKEREEARSETEEAKLFLANEIPKRAEELRGTTCETAEDESIIWNVISVLFNGVVAIYRDGGNALEESDHNVAVSMLDLVDSMTALIAEEPLSNAGTLLKTDERYTLLRWGVDLNVQMFKIIDALVEEGKQENPPPQNKKLMNETRLTLQAPETKSMQAATKDAIMKVFKHADTAVTKFVEQCAATMIGNQIGDVQAAAQELRDVRAKFQYNDLPGGDLANYNALMDVLFQNDGMNPPKYTMDEMKGKVAKLNKVLNPFRTDTRKFAKYQTQVDCKAELAAAEATLLSAQTRISEHGIVMVLIGPNAPSNPERKEQLANELSREVNLLKGRGLNGEEQVQVEIWNRVKQHGGVAPALPLVAVEAAAVQLG